VNLVTNPLRRVFPAIVGFQERYERRSAIITTNLMFSEWERIFKNPMTTMAAIDRMVHHAVLLDLMSLESYRAKEASDLYAEIGKLSTQLAWLKKKLDTLLTRAERLKLLERTDAELPLTTQTDLLSLNRTSLYYTPVAPSPQEVALKHRIDAIYTERPYYGVRRITAQLRREGVLVNHKAVARHMREMGLAGICPGPNLSKRAHQARSIPIWCAA
jgi:putative transposase